MLKFRDKTPTIGGIMLKISVTASTKCFRSNLDFKTSIIPQGLQIKHHTHFHATLTHTIRGDLEIQTVVLVIRQMDLCLSSRSGGI